MLTRILDASTACYAVEKKINDRPYRNTHVYTLNAKIAAGPFDFLAVEEDAINEPRERD